MTLETHPSIRELEEHNSFSLCADTVYTYIENLLGDRITDGDVKYVITGHSRGGAVGNLLADELMKKGVYAANVYNYNYAPPDTFCAAVRLYEYTNIFNLCNRTDIVPLLPGPIASAFTHPLTSWMKHGQILFFSQSEGIFHYIENHSAELYLNFFDLQLDPSDWPKSKDDADSDARRWLIGIVTKILCPVDVIITDEEGNSLASIIGDEVEYYGNTDGSIIILTDGDKKVIYFADESQKYNFSLVGTDTGTMTFSVEKCNFATGEVTESKAFSDVVLENGKTMYCSVDEAVDINNISLFVVEEEGGEMVYIRTIETDGTETTISNGSSTDDNELGFTYGDVNGDRSIDARDIVCLKKYLANLDIETGESPQSISAGADANGDGVVDAKDLVLIKKYVANFDYDKGESSVVLGPKNNNKGK